MSQSPLQRNTRKSLPVFAHVPSKLGRPSRAEAHESPLTSRSDVKAASSRYTSTGTSTFTTPAASSSLPLTPSGDSSDQATSNTPMPRSKTSGDLRTPVQSSARRSMGLTKPQTPIHYSPYATSTPSAGLSKSASIPFDMAASAKAARVATERSETPTVSTIKPKRFVRKKPLVQRVMDYPGTILDKLLMATPTSIDELLPSEHYAHPIALAVHSIHFLCIVPLWSRRDDGASILRSAPDRSVGGRWDRWEDEQRHVGRAWGLVIFTAVLLALSAANAVYLFSRFRTYDMQLRAATDPPSSPHASPIPAPHQTPDDPFTSPEKEQTETPLHKTLRVSWRVARFIGVGSYAAVMSMLGRPTGQRVASYGSDDKIQSLRVWDPPDFCLVFFCAYPPSSPLLAHLLTPAHPLLTPILHLVSATLLTHLATSFRQLVKDRLLLSAEVMREYDRRFVYKRIFGGKVDRGVQTSQAERVW